MNNHPLYRSALDVLSAPRRSPYPPGPIRKRPTTNSHGMHVTPPRQPQFPYASTTRR